VPVVVVLVIVMLVLAGCGGDDAGGASAATTVDVGTGDAGTDEEVPEVLDAMVTPDGEGTYRIDVTISSPYDRPERYADAWRVVGPDGTVFGVRELTHDHADEQPFTRSLNGVAIPADVRSIMVEARDLIGGWSGQAYRAEIPT
jgi:hypothetical protein